MLHDSAMSAKVCWEIWFKTLLGNMVVSRRLDLYAVRNVEIVNLVGGWKFKLSASRYLDSTMTRSQWQHLRKRSWQMVVGAGGYQCN
jgi:hypothetical protein